MNIVLCLCHKDVKKWLLFFLLRVQVITEWERWFPFKTTLKSLQVLFFSFFFWFPLKQMVFAWFFSGFPLKQWNNAMKLVSKVHEVLLCVGNQLGQKSKFLSGAWERISCWVLVWGHWSLGSSQLVHPLLETSFHLLTFSSNNNPHPRVSKANLFCLFFPSLLPNCCATSVRQGLVSEFLN